MLNFTLGKNHWSQKIFTLNQITIEYVESKISNNKDISRPNAKVGEKDAPVSEYFKYLDSNSIFQNDGSINRRLS